MNSNDKMRLTPDHPAGKGIVIPTPRQRRRFGQLLRAEYLTRGISRGEVLQAMGLHPEHHDYVLTAIEDGSDSMTVTQARALGEKLGIPAVHLMAEAGVASLAQLAATGDDMPLAGRPVTPPTVRPARFRSEEWWRFAVVAGLIAGVALSAAAAALIVLGDTTFTVVLSWFCVLGVWVCVSPAFAHLTGLWMGRGRSR